MTIEQWLPLVWFGIIGFGVFMYVLLDGFVLGIGILSRLVEQEADRDVMMNSVAPVWDGNETWLVLGGTALLAAFPVAYTVLLPALYLPLTVMLAALIFRGVAFEFRFKAERKAGWNAAFNIGSIVTVFCQGVTLGTIVQGIPADGGQYAGGAVDWLTVFSVITGLALMAGYALLGATWLVMKTQGPLQARAYDWSRVLLVCVIAFMVLVSVYVPFLSVDYAERWFGWPQSLYMAPFPLLAAAVSWGLYTSVRRRHTWLPFVLSLAMFAVGYGGLAASFWPHIIPPKLTIWNAAAPPGALTFLLAGTRFCCRSSWAMRPGRTGSSAARSPATRTSIRACCRFMRRRMKRQQALGRFPMRDGARRLLWFLGLSLASLAVTAAVAYGFRALVFFILSH